MKYHLMRLATIPLFVSCCFLAMASPVKAETVSNEDSWEIGGSAYLWGAGVAGTTVAGDEVDVSFTDVLDKLEGGLMIPLGPFQGSPKSLRT